MIGHWDQWLPRCILWCHMLHPYLINFRLLIHKSMFSSIKCYPVIKENIGGATGTVSGRSLTCNKLQLLSIVCSGILQIWKKSKARCRQRKVSLRKNIAHSFTDGHLGCFQHLAIVNCAAMNIGVHRFFWIGVSGVLGYNPSSGIAGSKGRSIFSFLRKFHSFPQWLHQSAFPPTMH